MTRPPSNFGCRGGERGHRWADSAFLRNDQYRTEANLCARQSIYAFQQPRVDLPRVVLDLAAPTSDDRVIDVGCGNGAYLSELDRRDVCRSVTGVDLSEGMLQAARLAMPKAEMLLADASALPVRDATATLVLAMHMLYHVPEPTVAVSEFRRVLVARGRVVVVLNAEDHLRELRQAVDEALQDFGLPPRTSATGYVWPRARNFWLGSSARSPGMTSNRSSS